MKPAKPPKPQFNPAGSAANRQYNNNVAPNPAQTGAPNSAQTGAPYHAYSQSGALNPAQSQVVQQEEVQQASPGAGETNLENMLGDLSSDMSRQGIMTVPKGHCAACAKPIIGQVNSNVNHLKVKSYTG